MKLLLFLSVFFILSCDYIPKLFPRGVGFSIKQEVPTATAPRPPSSNSNSPAHPGGVAVKEVMGTNHGVIYCGGQYTPDFFNKEFKRFLSTTLYPNQVGVVGCLKEHSGAFTFKAAVPFQDNLKLSLNALDKNLIVSETANLELQWEFSNNIYPSAIVKMKASPFAGAVDGSLATVTFEDSKGQVSFNGQITAKGFFEGTFNYENYTHVDANQTPAKGIVGYFNIRACHFFDCE